MSVRTLRSESGRSFAVMFVFTATMPQPMSTPTAAGMIAPLVGITEPTVAPSPQCTSGITAIGSVNGKLATFSTWAMALSSNGTLRVQARTLPPIISIQFGFGSLTFQIFGYEGIRAQCQGGRTIHVYCVRGIVGRTKAGMDAARRRGQHLGRPRKLNQTQLDHAKEMLEQGKSRNEVARILSVVPSTLYRRLQAS